MFDSLALCAGVVVAITFQKVDDTPYAKARPDCYDQGLQSSNCTGKKCHIKSPKLTLPGVTGNEKRR